MAPAPLDTAADAGRLGRVDRPAVEHAIEGVPQIAARDGAAVVRPAVVELSAIHEPAVAVEQKKVRRARCRVGLRDRLALVVAQRKTESDLPGPLLETFGTIVRV